MFSTEIPTLPSQQLTPGEQTLRQWYQGRMALELLQGTSMERNRQMLRRGAKKMQDGTLGQPGEPAEEEPVNISIGDTYQVMPVQQTPQLAAQPAVAPASSVSAGAGTDAAPAATEAPAAPAAATPLWKQVATVAAVIAGMGGAAGLGSYLTSQAAAPATTQQAAPAATPIYGVEVEKASP